MASRLSELSSTSIYERGHFATGGGNLDHQELLVPPPPDLESALTAKNPKSAIQAISPQTLYFALQRRGLEDSLDVLPLISRSQFVRIFDYTIWREDRLCPDRAFAWLELYQNLGKEEVAKRFCQLDEEYQLALLGPYLEIFDEDEKEKLSQAEQDRLIPMPCGTLFFKIKSEDPKVIQNVDSLVDAVIESDIGYAYSLIAHAAYLPPNEQEALIAQFRRARLEEDGFVSYTEGLQLFEPLENLRPVASGDSPAGLVLWSSQNESSFLSATINHGLKVWDQDTYNRVTSQFAHLTNALCAVSNVEPDDEPGLKSVLNRSSQIASIGLEFLAQGDLAVASQILVDQTASWLFRVGQSLFRPMQELLIRELGVMKVKGGDAIQQLWKAQKRGLLLTALDVNYLDELGADRLEILKGALNRYPVRFVQAESGRLICEPVSTLADYRELMHSVLGVCGVIRLSQLTLPSTTQSIDRMLQRGIANVLNGHDFNADELSDVDMRALLELDGETLESRIEEFHNAVLENATRIVESLVLASEKVCVVPVLEKTRLALMKDFSDIVLDLRTQMTMSHSAGVHVVKSLQDQELN